MRAIRRIRKKGATTTSIVKLTLSRKGLFKVQTGNRAIRRIRRKRNKSVPKTELPKKPVVTDVSKVTFKNLNIPNVSPGNNARGNLSVYSFGARKSSERKFDCGTKQVMV